MQTDMNLSQILSKIVNEYKKNNPRQAELECFRQQPTLESAIQCAALAKINGKRHPHQRRLKKPSIEAALQILMMNSKKISQAKDFDDLSVLVKKLCDPISGIGPLYIYDTSLRIGAKLNLRPDKVYLHAGTKVGARNLWHERKLVLDNKLKVLQKSQMPREFQKLEAYEIEDILCIYKNDFLKENINLNGRCC